MLVGSAGSGQDLYRLTEDDLAVHEGAWEGASDDVTRFFWHQPRFLSAALKAGLTGPVVDERSASEAEVRAYLDGQLCRASEIVRGSTYGEGLERLCRRFQDEPFTFAATVAAFVTDVTVHGDSSLLLGTRLDSVTGVVYQARTTNFKVEPRSVALEDVRFDSTQPFAEAVYDAVVAPVFDSADGTYDRLLTEEEFLAHTGWDALLGFDASLKRRLATTMYHVLGRSTGLAFRVEEHPATDRRRPVALVEGSAATVGMDTEAHFLHVL